MSQTKTNLEPRLDSDDLRSALFHFTGTEQWYRHPFNQRMIYTDGVKFLAENGGEQGAYWFLDKMALEACPLLTAKSQNFAAVTLTVNVDETAVITLTDGNDGQIERFDISYTDMQTGEWRFYLIEEGDDRVLLLPSEY